MRGNYCSSVAKSTRVGQKPDILKVRAYITSSNTRVAQKFDIPSLESIRGRGLWEEKKKSDEPSDLNRPFHGLKNEFIWTSNRDAAFAVTKNSIPELQY